MDVSIIIVNYNTKVLTIQCIESILKYTSGLTYEIIVVDNASSDDSCHVIAQQYPKTVLIKSAENIGFGRANNLGTNYAKGEYLFFLNSDTILIKNSIYSLFVFNESAKRKVKIGITGGVLLDGNEVVTGSFGPLPTMRKILESNFGLLPRFTDINEVQSRLLSDKGFFEVGYVMGADMFVKKSLFELIGGFDPIFFMYYEETDLQLRLNKHGYKNLIIKDAELIHLEGMSTNSSNTNNNKRIMFNSSMLLFVKKHHSKFKFIIFKYIYIFNRLSTLFQFNYSWDEKRKYLRQIIKI